MEKIEAAALQEIQNIYTDVSEWLKFAEAKHAGLFAVWTAVLIAVISIDGFLNKITVIKGLVLAVILIGILISLISFFPFLNRFTILKKLCLRKYQNYTENSVFYQSVFVDTYSEKGVQDSVDIYSKILEGKGLKLCNSELEKDYLKQIIEVSAVGTIKVYLFGIAVTYVFAVLVVFLMVIIIA